MKEAPTYRTQRLCEQGGGPGLSLPVPDKPYDFCGREAPRKKLRHTELRSSVNREAGLVSRYPFLINLMISVGARHHERSSDIQNSGAL